MTSDELIEAAKESGYTLVGAGSCDVPFRWRLADMPDAVATRLEGQNEFYSERRALVALGMAIAEAGGLGE